MFFRFSPVGTLLQKEIVVDSLRLDFSAEDMIEFLGGNWRASDLVFLVVLVAWWAKEYRIFRGDDYEECLIFAV